MPKTLTLMRHGKSSWEFSLQDQYRPLQKRAYNDIALVYNHFKQYINADTIYKSSHAVRAETTAREFLLKASISEHKLSIEEALYTFDPQTLQNFITSQDDSIADLMLFGHNPAFTAVANYLGDKYFDNVPTSGLVQIKFNSNSWKTIGNGKTNLHLFPKNLR